MIKLQQRSHCDLVSGVRELTPSYQLLIRGPDPGMVSGNTLWHHSRLVRSVLDSQGNRKERVIVMPDFTTEDILASVRMIEAVEIETETVLVFNWTGKQVLETLAMNMGWMDCIESAH